MQSKSALLRACIALLLAIVVTLVPHQLVQTEANAAQVSLRWDYTASGAAGFVLYCGPSSKNYPTRVDVGNTDSYVIATLKEGATFLLRGNGLRPSESRKWLLERNQRACPALPSRGELQRKCQQRSRTVECCLRQHDHRIGHDVGLELRRRHHQQRTKPDARLQHAGQLHSRPLCHRTRRHGEQDSSQCD